MKTYMVLACAAACSLAAVPALTATMANATTPPLRGVASAKKKSADSFVLTEQKTTSDQKATSDQKKSAGKKKK
jgi:hypothetical protein